MFSRTAKLERARTRALNEHRIRAVSVHDADYNLLEWRTVTTDERPHAVEFTIPAHWTQRRQIRMATWSKHGLCEWLDHGITRIGAGETLTCTLTDPSEWTVE